MQSNRLKSQISAPIFTENGPISVYDDLESAAYSYRLGLNILTIIIVGNICLLIILSFYWYTDEINEFMLQYKDDPTTLCLIFLTMYIVGNLLLVPPNSILIPVTITFIHIWGFWKGYLYTILFNYPAQQIAHLIVFFVGRYAFRDIIYISMIKHRAFYVLNRALIRQGAYVHFLARCSFMVPHPILTYILSVTDITVWQFINGNHSILPLSVFWVYVYASALETADEVDSKG